MAKNRKKKETSHKNQQNMSEIERRILSHEKDHMIDDHGFAIIGNREKKPISK